MFILRTGILQSGTGAPGEAEITQVDILGGDYPDKLGEPLEGTIYYDCSVAGKVDIDWEIWDNEIDPTVIWTGTIEGYSVTAGSEQTIDLGPFDGVTDTSLVYPSVKDEFNRLAVWIGDKPSELEIIVSDPYRVTDV